MRLVLLLFFPMLLIFSKLSAQNLNPILDWESLPEIRTGVKIRAYSSTNPTGRTMRDFRNYTREDAKGYEMINMMAAEGMIVHLWFTSLSWGNDTFGPGRFGRVNLYLSDGETPDFVKERDLYFQRPEYAMPRPLWDTDGLSQWAFPCLPFHDRVRLTSTETPHWYQVTTHIYRENRFSEQIPIGNLYDVNNRIQDYRGRFPGKERGNRLTDKTMELKPGSTVELFNWNQAGVIRSVILETENTGNDILDRVWLVVDYGEREKRAIEVPLTVFFGGYVNAPVTNAQGFPCGYINSGFYFYFPMPFPESCTMYLINRADEAFHFSTRIRWDDTSSYDPEGYGKFYIRYNDNIPIKAGEPDFVHLGLNGSGTLVGTTANLAGSIEGNFSIYIDDSKTPSVETTGGEDYFCHAFGIDVGLCTPFHGGLQDKIGYRFHIIDYVPFLRSIRFTQDHGHEYMHDREGIFRSAVFYYWNSENKLVLSDSIDIGDKKDEKNHDFSILTGNSNLRNDEGKYEGNYKNVFRDDGRWHKGAIRMNVRINPENEGVRIRRRINQQLFHQETEVYVDGIFAGTWFEQGTNYRLLEEPDPENHPDYTTDWEKINAVFRDTEFEVPVEFTRGKDHVTLEFHPKDGISAVDQGDEGYNNSYFYWFYSYVD